MSNICLRSATNRRYSKSFNRSIEADTIKCNKLFACESATGVGLTQNLNETLVVGNFTGGENIVMTNGNIVDGVQGDGIFSDPTLISIAGGLLTIPLVRIEGTQADLGINAISAAIRGGSGNTTGIGGGAFLLAGDGGSISGNGGIAAVAGGLGTTAGSNGGDSTIFTCNKTNAGDSGDASMTTGDTTAGNTGLIRLLTGDGLGGISGPITLTTGDSNTTNSGTMRIDTGDTTLAADSGDMDMFSGDANGTGDSGSIRFVTGNSAAGLTGEIEFNVSQATAGLASTGTVWTRGFHYIGNEGGTDSLARLSDIRSVGVGGTDINIIKSGGVIHTGNGASLLDTGALMDAGCTRVYSVPGTFDTTPPQRLAFTWFMANTDAGNITVTSPGASHTVTADMVVVANTSGMFLSRRLAATGSTANPIWNTVRMS